ARPYRRSPLDIARVLAAAINADVADTTTDSPIGSVQVAPPGFLNLRLTDRALEHAIGAILGNPSGWGRVPPLRSRTVNVEFVSANPTGPLTIGNARGAFVGDLLCRVLEAGGQKVTREYYFNDAGGQIDKLGASILAHRTGRPVPDDGYHGAYVADLAMALPADIWTAAQAMGFDPDRLQVILTGWVSIIRDGEVIAMSKREGDIYELDTLLDDVGADAARWFFASRSANIDIDIDVNLAKKQAADNPVFYVQYAHARIASILRKAADGGLAPAAGVEGLLAGAPDAALA